MRKSTIFIAATCAVTLVSGTVWRLRPQPAPTSHHSLPVKEERSVSDKISRIQSRETALSERLRAAREISTDLTNQELRVLMEFLAKPLDQENATGDLVAMNQVMDQIRVSGMACGEYATALCGLIREPKTHPVVRDYAMQHAVQWMVEAKHGQSNAKLEEKDRKRLLDCMVSYLQTPSSLHETGFGTALNLVRTIESTYPQDAREILALCSHRIITVSSGRESAPLGNRVAAIQCLPALPDREVAQKLVREMISTSQSDSPVGLVAVATLGSLGDESDLQTLRRIQQDDDNLSYAARSAAERLTVTLASSTR
jgi:hypothetical protein